MVPLASTPSGTKPTTKSEVPAIGNMPVIGNLFKNKAKSDELDELLVFIAPRVL